MSDITYYKMFLQADEDGLVIITQKWISIHETDCFHYCIRDFDKGFLSSVIRKDKETPLQQAKRTTRVKRIAKVCSRFAFDTEEKAFKHLQLLKRKQLQHMKRDIAFIEAFISDTADKSYSEALVKGRYGMEVPNTKDIVHQHLRFD